MCDINSILLVSFISVKMTLKYKLGRSVLEKYILLLSDLCLNMVVLSGIMHLVINIYSMKGKRPTQHIPQLH